MQIDITEAIDAYIRKNKDIRLAISDCLVGSKNQSKNEMWAQPKIGNALDRICMDEWVVDLLMKHETFIRTSQGLKIHLRDNWFRVEKLRFEVAWVEAEVKPKKWWNSTKIKKAKEKARKEGYFRFKVEACMQGEWNEITTFTERGYMPYEP